MIKILKRVKKFPKEILKLFGTAVILFFVTLFLFFEFLRHQEYVRSSPYDVVVSDIQANTAIISWKTVVETPTFLRILPNEKLLGKGELSTFHRVKVLNLKELFPYQFVITDGRREWERPYLENSKELSLFVQKEYSFVTNKLADEVSLPKVDEVSALPKELVFISLYDKRNNQYLGIKSFIANQFGGIALDVNAFNPNLSEDEYDIKVLNYFSPNNLKSSLNSVYAYEINCDQSVPEQTIDGVTREQFANYATRWVGGRGKNYAYECFNDVVYSSRMAGVDPAFSLTVWLNESAASNYTQNSKQYGYIEDFGIHGNPSVPPHDFKAQLNHFLSRSHNNSCPGLNQWESWGNIYRYGTCNQNDPIQRQHGINYYKSMESLYTWITNGRKLPNRVTGLPIPVDVGADGGNWTGIANPICCALKYTDSENFFGEYIEDSNTDICPNVWKEGEELNGRIIQSSVAIDGKKGLDCISEYSGVCCKLYNNISWYPKESCPFIVQGINSFNACNEYASKKACFYRDYFYQWLPINIGEDSLKDVSSELACRARNEVYKYEIQLNEGINFIGFDFNPSFNKDVLYASRLLNLYPEIVLIGNFYNNEWENLIKRSDSSPFVGQDFYFEQGKGYLVITNDKVDLKLDGWEIEDAYIPELSQGWNLVGGKYFSSAQKASMVISKLKETIPDIDAVGVWSYELSSLKFRVEQSAEIVFGDDFELSSNQAIFVRK